MTTPRPPLAVIFDMDGVLIDSYATHYKTWQIVCARRGREWPEETFAAGFGRRSRDVLLEYWGEPLSDQEIADLDQEKETCFRSLIAENFPSMAGARELLAALAESGVGFGIGTSGPPGNAETVIDQLGIRESIGALVTGNDVQNGKPAPDVFLQVADRLETLPENCVVLEDAPVGIQAARAAGMRCVGVVSRGHTPEQLADADVLVSDLTEVSVEMLFRVLSLEC